MSNSKWMNPNGKSIVKHPGALRSKAKSAGLIKGDQNLTPHALSVLSHSKSGATRRQVSLAKTFKHAFH